MNEVMIGSREASEKYRVSYGTLIRRVNSGDRPFATQARRATPDSDSSVWRIAESELAGLYELRDNAEAAEAQQSLDDAAAEVDRLKKELGRQAEQLQSARNEAAHAVDERDKESARADKAWERVDSLNKETEKKIADANGERDGYKQAASDISAVLDEVLHALPEKAQLRRKERNKWDAERKRLWTLNSAAKKQLTPGGAPSEAASAETTSSV